MVRVLFLAALLAACSEQDPRFLTPASTFSTYRSAVLANDAATAWSCLSQGHQADVGGLDDFAARLRDSRFVTQVRRLQMQDERVINQQLAFVQFDSTTVGAGTSPFFYYLWEADGWKITTHTDSLFRARLEAALDSGEFTLPAPR